MAGESYPDIKFTGLEKNMSIKKICAASAALCLLLAGCSKETSKGLLMPELSETPVPEEIREERLPEEDDGQNEEAPSADFDNGGSAPDISGKHADGGDMAPEGTGSQDTGEAGGAPEVPEEITALLQEIITPSMSEYEKVRAIHDYLVIHVDYDYDNLAAGTLPDTAFTAEGALLLHSAVCEGYAKAFSLLCDQSGIENILVYGTADDGTGVQTHAWNQVRVDGEWYNIDVTWDDPLMNGEQVTDGSNLIYDYFLVPDLTLLGNHTARITDPVQTCTSERYLEENRRLTIAPYLAEPCTFATSDEEVQTAIEQYLSDGIRTFQIVCDVTSCSPEGRAEFTLNGVKTAMEARAQSGQISVETQYGIADYAVIDVSITP